MGIFNPKGGQAGGWRLSRKLMLLTLLSLPGVFAAILLFESESRHDAGQTLARAAEAWDAGNYKLAAKEYEGFLERHPAGEESSAARFQLANIYYLNLHNYEQARAHYKEIIERGPADANAYAARERLAEVLAQLGRSYEAIAEYENLRPEEASERRRIRLLIANLYFDQKNYSQALTEYEKVVDAADYDELSEQAYQREASIYHILRGQYRQALPVYQKLASRSQDKEVRLRATYALADCYGGLYQFDEAIQALRQIEDESEQGYISRRVAELERRKREAAEARSGINQ